MCSAVAFGGKQGHQSAWGGGDWAVQRVHGGLAIGWEGPSLPRRSGGFNIRCSQMQGGSVGLQGGVSSLLFCAAHTGTGFWRCESPGGSCIPRGGVPLGHWVLGLCGPAS